MAKEKASFDIKSVTSTIVATGVVALVGWAFATSGTLTEIKTDFKGFKTKQDEQSSTLTAIVKTIRELHITQGDQRIINKLLAYESPAKGLTILTTADLGNVPRQRFVAQINQTEAWLWSVPVDGPLDKTLSDVMDAANRPSTANAIPLADIQRDGLLATFDVEHSYLVFGDLEGIRKDLREKLGPCKKLQLSSRPVTGRDFLNLVTNHLKEFQATSVEEQKVSRKE